MVRQTGNILVLAMLCFLSSGCFAAPVDAKRAELPVLREKIRNLQDEIARGEETQGEAADELAGSDKNISAAKRRLREIAQQRQSAEDEVLRLLEQKLALENELAILRKTLGDAVFRLYVEGGQGGTRRFLSGDNPNQLSRDAYYLEQIARQRIAAIDKARVAMLALRGVVEAAETRQKELVKLEKQRIAEQAQLVSERNKQRDVLAHISTQLRQQRKQMATLQRDELRMEKLIKGLERIARSTPNKPLKPANSAAPSGAKSEPVTGIADVVAGTETGSAPFANLKGRLRWPVRGELTGRFGTQRAEGGPQWRGVFILSAAGGDVRAIAAGKVAFADWMRGFGNLVIVDHGDAYMTVYGNNESVFKNPGDEVKAGEVIASVGASGGQGDSGLYFEIRYRGQPQDPAKWVAGK